jgi:hypothetical protein
MGACAFIFSLCSVSTALSFSVLLISVWYSPHLFFTDTLVPTAPNLTSGFNLILVCVVCSDAGRRQRVQTTRGGDGDYAGPWFRPQESVGKTHRLTAI